MLSIPEHELITEVGSGAFGKVYQAIHTGSNTYRAVKIFESIEDEQRIQLAREVACLQSQQSNPYVVRILESDLKFEPPYIVMEFADGGTLANSGKLLTWAECAAAIAQCAAGLESIHAAGGFHRDIKPSNLLVFKLEKGGVIIKLGDFGLARIPGATEGTMTYKPWGTPNYMAPEVRRAFSEGRIDGFSQAADVYSLGVTAIELMTKKRSADALNEVDLPESLKKLLRQMVAKSPGDRPGVREVINLTTAILQPAVNSSQPKPPTEVSPPRGSLKANSTSEVNVATQLAAAAAIAVMTSGLLSLLLGGLIFGGLMAAISDVGRKDPPKH